MWRRYRPNAPRRLHPERRHPRLRLLLRERYAQPHARKGNAVQLIRSFAQHQDFIAGRCFSRCSNSVRVSAMLVLLQDLVRHKAHANASLLRAVRNHEAAARDTEIRALLHHVILANRFWFSLMRGISFQPEHESHVPDSLGEVAELYRNTHSQELEWIAGIQNTDLARTIETPFILGQTFSIEQT